MAAVPSSTGQDAINGQLISGPWRGLYLPGPVYGTTVRGVGGDMGLPTVPYLTAQQTGGSVAGRSLTPNVVIILALMFAASVLLMRQIHWG